MTDPLSTLLPPRSIGIVTTPVYERHGDEHTVQWAAPPVTMTFTRVHDGSRGLHAEITVTHGPAEIHCSEINLVSTSSRETIVKKLLATLDTEPWRTMIEFACRTVRHAARQGSPLVTLTGQAAPASRELLRGLLYEGEPTSVIADGDTGKSLVGITLAAVVQSGTPLPFGLKPSRAMLAAYLDWETGQSTTDDRLGRVAAGFGIDPPAILYKRMTRPLVAEAAALAAEFSRRKVGFVVIDSMMFAVASGEGAAFHEPITAFYNALSLFAPAASLVLNHITNADARSGGPARPFGGAFAFNGPRLIWEAKRDREISDATAIAFTCIKSNNLPRRPDPFGLRFTPGPNTTTVSAFDLKDASASVVGGATMTYRIRLALATGIQTPEAIAKHLPAKLDSVTRLLRRLRENGKAKERPDGTWEIVA